MRIMRTEVIHFNKINFLQFILKNFDYHIFYNCEKREKLSECSRAQYIPIHPIQRVKNTSYQIILTVS